MSTLRLLRSSTGATARALSKTTRPVTGRTFASYQGPPPLKSGGSTLYWTLGLVGVGAAGAYILNSPPTSPASTSAAATPGKVAYGKKKVGVWKADPKLDYQKVYNAIAEDLEMDPDYDDGSYGPVLLRLAWHAAGTYSRDDESGGSEGATMRHQSEGGHGANAGLDVARTYLERVKKRFPQITYADLWSLGGVVAVQEMGGPTIAWRPGREDRTEDRSTPDGRLPDASLGSKHIRDIFYRMGFSDQEIVALIGAHALGRCHTTRSGYDGPWTASPTMFTNDFYERLLNDHWEERKWSGPTQLKDKETGELMMLPADYAIRTDGSFRKWAEIYAKDVDRFFKDFAAAFQKLEELGVEFAPGTPTFRFKSTLED